MAAGTKKTSKSDKNSNSSYGSGKNAGVRKNLKNATERGKNGGGSNTAGTAHKKKNNQKRPQEEKDRYTR